MIIIFIIIIHKPNLGKVKDFFRHFCHVYLKLAFVEIKFYDLLKSFVWDLLFNDSIFSGKMGQPPPTSKWPGMHMSIGHIK